MGRMTLRPQQMWRWLSIGIALASPVANAAPEAHDGFLFRFQVGPAWARTETVPEGDALPLAIRGQGVAVSFSLGGSLTPQLALHGDAIVAVLNEPVAELGELSGPLKDTSVSVGGIGIGGTWFHTSTNVYVSASLLATSLTLDSPKLKEAKLTARTGLGPGLGVTVGKEWFISDEWGLGASLSAVGGMGLSSRDVDGEGPDFTTSTSMGFMSVQISATYH